MSEVIPLIVALASAASTIVSTSAADDRAAAAASAAEKKRKADELAFAKQQGEQKNAVIDQAAMMGAPPPDLSAQIRAKVAAGEQAAPGMSTEFFTQDAQKQYPGLSNLIAEITAVQQQPSGSQDTGQP